MHAAAGQGPYRRGPVLLLGRGDPGAVQGSGDRVVVGGLGVGVYSDKNNMMIWKSD